MKTPYFMGFLACCCTQCAAVQQVKGDATHIFVADFVRRREVKERPGTPPPLGPSVAATPTRAEGCTCQKTFSVGPAALV